MNKKQQAEYRKNEWKEFRLKILETDNYTCCRCNEYYGETPSFLNVHHNTYYRHRKPWDYPIDTLTTLCRKCHAQEHGIIIPDSDWEFVSCYDEGELSAECEYCGNKMRYVHILYHPNWGYIQVGCKCADKLTESNDGSEYEKYLKRMIKFINSNKWIKEDENTIIYKNYCSCYIKIQKQDNQYSVEINGYQLQKYYSNINDAKEAAYSSISSERISELLNEQKNLLKAALEQGVNEKKWICSIYNHDIVVEKKASANFGITIDGIMHYCENTYLSSVERIYNELFDGRFLEKKQVRIVRCIENLKNRDFWQRIPYDNCSYYRDSTFNFRIYYESKKFELLAYINNFPEPVIFYGLSSSTDAKQRIRQLIQNYNSFYSCIKRINQWEELYTSWRSSGIIFNNNITITEEKEDRFRLQIDNRKSKRTFINEQDAFKRALSYILSNELLSHMIDVCIP